MASSSSDDDEEEVDIDHVSFILKLMKSTSPFDLGFNQRGFKSGS